MEVLYRALIFYRLKELFLVFGGVQSRYGEVRANHGG